MGLQKENSEHIHEMFSSCKTSYTENLPPETDGAFVVQYLFDHHDERDIFVEFRERGVSC